MRGSRYETDVDITGAEKVLAIDSNGENVSVLISGIVTFANNNIAGVKNPGSAYDGFIVISGEGNSSVNIVQAGDILVGANTLYSSGDVVVAVADIDNPADGNDLTIKINLR